MSCISDGTTSLHTLVAVSQARILLVANEEMASTVSM